MRQKHSRQQQQQLKTTPNAMKGLLAITTSTALLLLTVNAQLPEAALPPQENTDVLELAQLIGIGQFVSEPTRYQFVCGEGSGEITAASLEGERMTISYRYPTDTDIRTGQLVGTVNSDGIFIGTYRTESLLGLLQGNITFAFNGDGTAEGSYANGTGTTRIFL